MAAVATTIVGATEQQQHKSQPPTTTASTNDVLDSSPSALSSSNADVNAVTTDISSNNNNGASEIQLANFQVTSSTSRVLPIAQSSELSDAGTAADKPKSSTGKQGSSNGGSNNQAYKEKANKKMKDKKTKNSNKKELNKEKPVKAPTQSNDHNQTLDSQHAKPRSLVEELKLFQNNHLLNQQDPIQQLQQQLNGIIGGDDDIIIGRRAENSRSSKSFQQAGNQVAATANEVYGDNRLSPSTMQEQQGQQSSGGLMVRNSMICTYDGEENTFTIKKGILWQQQIYEKFHQRLFSRWKKRYFILTTDYFVCFKRSSSKVGRSEMGKFLYKTALSDVTKISWSRPTKSDKGAIILYINGQFNLFLWSKKNLDEWMFMIEESIERNRIRRSCILQNNGARGVIDCDVTKRKANLELIGASGALGSESCKNYNENNNGALSEKQNDIRSQTIAKCSKNNKGTPFEAITKLRSQQQKSADEGNDGEELNLSGNIDSPAGRKKESIRVKSSPLSVTSTNSSSRGKKANLIESKHQVEDNVLNDDHKKPSAAENDVRASGRGRKPIMINDSVAKNDSRASKSTIQEGSVDESRKGISVDDSRKSDLHPGGELNQVSNDLSSESNQTAGVNGSLSSRKADEKDDDSNESPDSSLTEKNQPILVKSGGKRSNKRRLNAKTSEESTGDESCNSSNSHSDIKQDRSIKIKRNSVACDTEKSSINHTDGDAKPKKADNHEQKPLEKEATQRQTSNLIRRDDSWQSLMSLTRVGKITPATIQVAQRSLYAQHIMPAASNGVGDRQRYSNREGNMINIESTVTPSRGPFSRQQSIQVLSSQRKLRPILALRQQAASFDVAPSSPMLANQRLQMQFQQQLQQSATSYQQRLLQLQLLHNSNNVDYIRHNGDSSNDYQIYWPESTAYGYSSMRSNLKSAASEFSFIRPSPSSHGQSTLPHQSHLSSHLLDNQGTQQQPPIRSSLILSDKSSKRIQQSDSDNNSIGCFSQLSKPMYQSQQQQQRHQFLVNPLTGERLINQQALGGCAKDLMIASELTPPMRELPLKPNKKRTPTADSIAANGSGLPKSSSLTSSIACFFRRAFSRRSKRKRRSKLAESCSSSLGAFDDGFPNVPIVPSAFSTGGKSVDGRKNLHNNNGGSCNNGNNLPMVQSQRMVDMIEAFTNKTLAAAAAAEAGIAGGVARFDSVREQPSDQQQQQALSMELNVTPKVAAAQLKSQHQLTGALNQFGSPLHKSNSICATMGLSLADSNGRRTYLYDNEVVTCEGSPMLTRSTKMMSANLTPVTAQREAPGMSLAESSLQHQQQQQFFISPRNSRSDQLPRPSSIYGQPSMISSPMITREERHNFGVHRNSLHNHNFRDRNHGSGIEIRRQMMKVPFLDPTREVAEDISSPTTEMNDHDYEQADRQARCNQAEQSSYGRYLIIREKFDMISASPSSGKLQPKQQQHHPHAIVNPILQSPTMDAIYDNHPMLNGAELNLSYSHYDNHNQLLIERHGQSPSLARAQSHFMQAEMPLISPLIMVNESPYSSRLINVSNTAQSYTPSHHQRFPDVERSTAMDMMLINKKPSAIVAPSTPNRSSSFNHDMNSMNSSPIIDRYKNHNQSPPQPQSSRSPMITRRIVNSQPQYQQSPLVSSQTRVLNKGDRIQATIIGDQDVGNGRVGQPVVNIAGAPGINLEPSLAASLLRGTNIDAYESSTFDRLTSIPAQSNLKTFLVSTRLSKSMAYSHSSSNNDNNSTSSSAAREENVATSRWAKDELSSSGSRSMNSSIGHGSLRTRGANFGTISSQEDQQGESSGSDTHGNGSRNRSVDNGSYIQKKSSREPLAGESEKNLRKSFLDLSAHNTRQ